MCRERELSLERVESESREQVTVKDWRLASYIPDNTRPPHVVLQAYHKMHSVHTTSYDVIEEMEMIR